MSEKQLIQASEAKVGMYMNKENGAECHPFKIVECSSTGKTVTVQAVSYSPDPRKDLRMPHQNWIYNNCPYGEKFKIRYDSEHGCWKKSKSPGHFFLHDEPVHRRNWEM